MTRSTKRWAAGVSVRFSVESTPEGGAEFALAVTQVSSASAEETIKVGVLHSLSGTMAISEVTVRDLNECHSPDQRARKEKRAHLPA